MYPPSSIRKLYPGRARESSSNNVFSARLSAAVTKSPGPLTETCRFSTSPKSRFRPRPALSAAAVITFIRAERIIKIWQAGGEQKLHARRTTHKSMRPASLVRDVSAQGFFDALLLLVRQRCKLRIEPCVLETAGAREQMPFHRLYHIFRQ